MTGNKTALKPLSARRAAIGIAAVLLCFLLACAIVPAGAETDKTVIENGSHEMLQTVCEVGAEYELPTDVAINHKGKLYDASVILRDPDGNGITDAVTVLNKSGTYTVEYRAQADGKILIAKQSFDCLNRLFKLSSVRSKAEYVTELEMQNGIIGGAGISAAVAKGDSFTYNQVIDLSDAAANERLISFYVAPETLYNYDAGQINFVFTDAFDSSNTLTVSVKRTLLYSAADMHQYSYVTANAAGQPPTAINQPVQAQYPAVTVDGERYSLHVSNAYGRAVRHSMYGGHDEADDASDYLGKTMSISYDAATKRVWAWAKQSSSPVLVADLDDPAIYENPWGGFTDGKVTLSVNMSSYRTLASHVVITQIANDDLSQTYAHDRFAPVINADLNGYNRDSLPKARVGTAYPLFKATASDETSGSSVCDASVWYNYSSEETRMRISVINGAFTPAYEGEYTVVYSAKDSSGNVVNDVYNVTAENLPELTLNRSQTADSIAAGKEYAVNNVSLTGGSGRTSLKITATSSNGAVYEFNRADNKYFFVPLAEGKYTVKYEYSDWLQNKSETEELTVTAATGAYIDGEAAVPKYAISGATYSLPSLSGYVFENGAQRKDCTAAINGGEISGNTFKVTAASGSVTLTYTLEQSGGEKATKTYDIPVIAGTGVDGEARTLDMSKLFTESTTPVAPQGYERKTVSCAFTANDYTGRPVFTVANDSALTMAYGSFDFVNKVLASRFQTRFALSSTEFMRVVIYVTDSVNKNQQIKITYSNGGSWKMGFAVNGGYLYSTSYNGNSAVELSYDSEHGTVSTDSITAPVATYLNGERFNGFESGFVYVTYQIEGVYAAADSVKTGAIRVDYINNQTISANKTDGVDPEVTQYVGKGDLSVNTVTQIPAFAVCDVINPYSVISVRITAPSGAVVTSVDGVALDGTQNLDRAYDIKLTEYGSYAIQVEGFVGKDRNEFSSQYGIQVLDMSAPAVTFINPVTAAKVGDTVAFAPVHVADDVTKPENIKITVYLMAPNGSITDVNIAEYGSFTAAEAGEYRVIVYACDEGNNYGSATVCNTAIVWYTVTVTA